MLQKWEQLTWVLRMKSYSASSLFSEVCHWTCWAAFSLFVLKFYTYVFFNQLILLKRQPVSFHFVSAGDMNRQHLITLHLSVKNKYVLKIHNAHKPSFTVTLCNKSRVQQRKTKVMWTDNILMGVIKDCKWSMEATAQWCFDVGILREMPGTMPSLRGMQNGRHFPLPLSHTLSLNIPASPPHSVTLEFRGSLTSFAVRCSTPVSHQPILLSAYLSPSSSHIN